MAAETRTGRVVYVLTGLALALGAAGLGVLVIGVFRDRSLVVWAGVAVVALAAVAGSGVQLLSAFLAREEQRRLAAEAKAHLLKAVGRGRRETLAELIQFNRTEMELYQNVARTQAESSFRAAVGAAGFGLAVLTCCLAALLSVDTPRAQAVAAVAGTVGTALAGYIGRSFLTTYRLTLRQMSYYYLQPQVVCYLLHAEHLAKDLDGPAEAAARMRILAAVLGAADRAQAQVDTLTGAREQRAG
jgi:hypothetical protein